MTPTFFPSIRDRRERERRIWILGIALSVALHLLVVLLFWSAEPLPPSPFAAAGPRSGDVRAAGGEQAGGMRAVNVQPEPIPPIVPPALPTPTMESVEPIEITEETAVGVEDVLGDLPGLDEPSPGVGGGDGSGGGDGGTADEGRFTVVPPSPRGLIIPPTSDRLRGRELSVWVFVDERGRVVSDSTRLEPSTGDRDFDRRLIREASEWIFEPAREGGEPVAAWFPYTIRM